MNPKLRGSSPATEPEPNPLLCAIWRSLPFVLILWGIAILLVNLLAKFS